MLTTARSSEPMAARRCKSRAGSKTAAALSVPLTAIRRPRPPDVHRIVADHGSEIDIDTSTAGKVNDRLRDQCGSQKLIVVTREIEMPLNPAGRHGKNRTVLMRVRVVAKII